MTTRVTRSTVISTISAITVICLPGSVGKLQVKVRLTIVIAYNKNDMVTASTGSFNLGKIQPGNSVRGNIPGCRYAPVAAIQKTGHGIA